MSLQAMLITGIVLFAVGVYGVLAKRDMLRILMSVAIMLGSITIIAVVLAQTQETTTAVAMGQSFVLFTWIIEVMEILFALALFIYLVRSGHADVSTLRRLKW